MKTYALLRDALAGTGKIGIASAVLHSKQHLAAPIPAGRVLALNTLRGSEEIRRSTRCDCRTKAQRRPA
ncbi:Ku protein [Paraburkholderia sp. BL10I2N1]|uniref:Ku protein n=1 Tax=Paraburkholderia sp. BL10I2N1 TaxID=1938796 RepID=UPI0024416D1A|nr:Ku protein [Paraburkholderia sp. BL10I2N1]